MSPILGIYASQVSGKLWPASSYESISTVTVGSGGASSIVFSSIPSTYSHLQIRMISQTNRNFSGNFIDAVYLQLNSTSTAIYHQLIGNGSAASANASEPIYTYQPNSGSSTSIFGASIVDILDYSNTNKNKTIRALFGFDVNGSGGFVGLNSALSPTTAAITSITITSLGNYNQYSSFALYGVN